MPDSKIMIVEDEALVAADLRIQLENLGYKITAAAASGAKA